MISRRFLFAAIASAGVLSGCKSIFGIADRAPRVTFGVLSDVHVRSSDEPMFTDEQKRNLVSVAFPSAQTVDGCRPFEYEVTATLHEDDVDLVACQKRVPAADFHLPPSQCGRPTECRFTADELPPEGHFTFEVRPLDCFGLKGKAISAGFKLEKF